MPESRKGYFMQYFYKTYLDLSFHLKNIFGFVDISFSYLSYI